MTRKLILFAVCAFEVALILFVVAWTALAGNWNNSPTGESISYTKPAKKFFSFRAPSAIPSLGSVKGYQFLEENGQEILRFSLIDGMRGGSKLDSRERHGAPYWERAEFRSDYLNMNFKYRLKYEIRFVKGFEKQDETVTQIHQWSKDCEGVKKEKNWSTGKKRVGTTPIRKFAVVNNRWYGLKIDEVLGSWQRVQIDVDGPERLFRIFVNDKRHSEVPFTQFECGKIFFKIGLYRPGSWPWEREAFPDQKYHSVVDFKNVSLTKY